MILCKPFQSFDADASLQGTLLSMRPIIMFGHSYAKAPPRRNKAAEENLPDALLPTMLYKYFICQENNSHSSRRTDLIRQEWHPSLSRMTDLLDKEWHSYLSRTTAFVCREKELWFVKANNFFWSRTTNLLHQAKQIFSTKNEILTLSKMTNIPCQDHQLWIIKNDNSFQSRKMPFWIKSINFLGQEKGPVWCRMTTLP